MFRKIDKVNATVNAIKAIKTVEVIGVAVAMTPVNAVIGAIKGVHDTVQTEIELIDNLWFKESEAN